MKILFSDSKFICLGFLIISLAESCSRKHIAQSPPKAKAEKIKEAYAEILKVDQKDITDIDLYKFIDEWYGVPYKYSGKSKSGVDCSGFTCSLYTEVYKKPLSGTSSSIFNSCKTIKKADLKEGDLVFFKINSDKISHIGIYLQNNRFVHASTQKGVIINDLDEPYYKKYFYKGGRLN
jgi:murein DD-endopeptidase / murein LD-carboxypeptidase